MVSKVFIDANVLLDLVLHCPRYQSAKNLYRYIEEGNARGFISPSIVHIVAYWTKKLHNSADVKDMLTELCNRVEVLNVGHEITMQALMSEMNDVEDALQYHAALAHGMEVFVSNDKHLKKAASSALPVLDPEEFVKILQSQ